MAATVESAREHIRNAIQMFARAGSGESGERDLAGLIDAAIARLMRALAELEAGRV